MDFIKGTSIKELLNPGVVSRQLINPENSRNSLVTITEVHVDSGATQPRHMHETSEQSWYALKGFGKLLLAEDKILDFHAGDAVRFETGETHGFFNDSPDKFIYISVTTPPVNFKGAYKSERN